MCENKYTVNVYVLFMQFAAQNFTRTHSGCTRALYHISPLHDDPGVCEVCLHLINMHGDSD